VLGHELFSLGKVHEAKVVFEGLLVANPNDSFALTMLGTVYLSLQELDRALEAFERALELDPDDVAARVYRGELRLNKRRNKGALEDFAQALKLARPDDPFADRARRLMKLARAATRPSKP
jgi:cytochrome c-type biogenesis protein CcmH/NrfG